MTDGRDKMKRYQTRYKGSTCSVVELSGNDTINHTYGVKGKLEPLSRIVKNGVNWDFFNMKASAKQETISWTYSDEGITDFFNGDNYIEVALTKDNTLVVEDVDIRKAYQYKWVTMGGFTLLRNGKTCIERKVFFPHYRYRHPRTAIGQKADKTIVVVVVDGRRWNERGMSAYTLAEFMRSLGCVIAVAGDGGGSSEMYFSDIGVYNRPSDGRERYIGGAFEFDGDLVIPYTKLVRYGSRGAHVKEVQAKLGLVTDGIAGRKTSNAIKQYQNKHGLVADGIVGKNTWSMMFGR